MNAVAGLVRPQLGGKVLFDGRPIEQEAPHRIVTAGIALVPEGRRLFGGMSVIDNFRIGAYLGRARAGQPEERRAAADPGTPPPADVRAETTPTRRAIPRPQPASGQRSVFNSSPTDR